MLKLKLKPVFDEARTLLVACLFLIPLVFVPFFETSFVQGKEITLRVIIVLGLLVSLPHLSKKEVKIKDLSTSPLFWLLLAQLGWHLLTNATSETPLPAMYGSFTRGEGFIMEGYYFVLMVWTALTLKPKKVQPLLKIGFISASLVAAYALFQKAGIDPFFANYSTNIFQGRVFSFLGNPSMLGQFMVLSLIMGAYLFGREKTLNGKLTVSIGLALTSFALLFSGTRSAVLALIFITGLSILKYLKPLLSHVRKMGFKVLVVLPLLAILFVAVPMDRFAVSKSSLRSLYSRFEIWSGAIELVKEKPLLGYGQETFYIHFPSVATQEFFFLEEDLNLSADRVHNDLLEEVFHHGIPAGALYLMMMGYTLHLFFRSKEPEVVVFAAIILANGFQNQFSFPEPTSYTLMTISWGALVSHQLTRSHKFKLSKSLTVGAYILLMVITYWSIVKPVMSHSAHFKFRQGTGVYSESIHHLKRSLYWTPWYSATWYDLIFADPSSLPRGLKNIEAIDGQSGDWLAWNGNLHAKTDPTLAADYFLLALEKNPQHPNWIRAFADMLYSQEDYASALYLYQQYMEAVPEFWKWSDDLEARTEKEQKSYETFFKHIPYFWGTVEKMNHAQEMINN